jgi:hypothetical protein
MRVKTTRITVESETITTIRRFGADRSWCPVCAAEVAVVAIEGLAGILPDDVAQSWIARGELHVSRYSGKSDCICLDSLLQCFQLQRAQNPNSAKETS